ncbi:MAG TPA: PIN domain-containing protein [Kofleriaceae bacterium]|jgi:predicted nucleic acid-binding protein|nr:PIN domain-containing protein [Kofleriaceae bacterium]
MILDTNAVSGMLEGDSALEALLAREARHELPVIVIGEYRYGLARSRHRRSLLPLFEELIRESIVLSVSVETAAAYAAVRQDLRAQGTPIPENDVWISALAIEHGLDIVSRDTDFDRVAGVRRRSW